MLKQLWTFKAVMDDRYETEITVEAGNRIEANGKMDDELNACPIDARSGTLVYSDTDYTLIAVDGKEIKKEVNPMRKHLCDIFADCETATVTPIVEGQFGVELEIWQCTCGFHIGMDATFLEQVNRNPDVRCPACTRQLSFVDKEGGNDG